MAQKVGVWVNYLLSTLGFVEVNFSFFLKVLIISTNFWVLYRTINIRHICSIYHSLIHSTTPQNRWRHLCADRPHSDHPHITVDPNLTFLCSTSSLPFQSHLLLAWPVTKKRKREKTGIWHVDIGKNFAKNDMTKIFIKHNPNYSSRGYQISKISEIGS